MGKTVFILMASIIAAVFYLTKSHIELSAIQSELLLELAGIYLIASLTCFVVSSLNKNYSQVDKLWSIMPMVYVWYVYISVPFDPRILIMSILVTIWGLRLSFNFWRRGGYTWPIWKGEEDYRWEVLRKKPEFQGRGRWMLFNFFFISSYQMGLILLFTLPIIASLDGPELNGIDIFLAIGILVLIGIETLADQQQWNFHKVKREKAATSNHPKEPNKGFLDQGLWSIVRHPNYAAEQSIWVLFYLFSVNAEAGWFNWSVFGCILLVLLFHGSANFSEAISSSKYPGYKDYCQRVGRFLPKF